jgi:hypothetical protein
MVPLQINNLLAEIRQEKILNESTAKIERILMMEVFKDHVVSSFYY